MTLTPIRKFVERVTTEGSADFVAEPERIATFDNDGTLWVEHPIYTQFAFSLDRVRALAPEHPDWATTQPFKAVLDGDMKALAATGEKGAFEIIAATHAGMSTAEFETIVTDWIATAKHPRFQRPYTEGGDGTLRAFEVVGAAGVAPLQQYLLAPEPGRPRRSPGREPTGHGPPRPSGRTRPCNRSMKPARIREGRESSRELVS